ncbi:MAG: hypothetical protein ABSF53_14465, partial [Terracidiphilus sp.]
VKPGQRREEEQQTGEGCGAASKPIESELVDENDGRNAGQRAEDDERQVCIVQQAIQETAEADVEKIAWRVRLMNPRVKSAHAEGEVYRIDVVEIVAPECETANSHPAGQ